MEVNRVSKTVEVSYLDNVIYQLHTYFFTDEKKHDINRAGTTVLALLLLKGEQNLKEFCDYIHSIDIYSSSQSVRNLLTEFEKKDLVHKKGTKKKTIYIDSKIRTEITTNGNILLDYKLFSRESSKAI